MTPGYVPLDDGYHTANRAVLRDIARRGHLVGNHTYHHVQLDYLRPEALTDEIDRTEALITQTLGHRSWLLRAPFGALTRQRTVDAVFSRGYTPVFWELDTPNRGSDMPYTCYRISAQRCE